MMKEPSEEVSLIAWDWTGKTTSNITPTNKTNLDQNIDLEQGLTKSPEKSD
jgi:hypothetical protein